MVPAMVPIFLLGSAVYLALQLTREKLSYEKFKEDSLARVQVLEAEVNALQEKRAQEAIAISHESNKKSRWYR